jgi:CheY-like chemotaxis protein
MQMADHVLVLDDNPFNVERMQQFASSAQYVFVADPKMAMYVFYEYDVDRDLRVIACNVGLRSGDVFEFLRTIKSHPGLATLPLICYCVAPDLSLDALRVVAETLGADEFIASYTFDAQTICSEVQHWLAMTSGFSLPPETWGYDDFAAPG